MKNQTERYLLTDVPNSIETKSSFEWTNEVTLTASFGIAQRKKETSTDFIARADKALYAAKAQGRNKVIKAK